MKKIALGIFLTVLMISFGYCQVSTGAEESVIKQARIGNFVLYVSNQSLATNLVDIKVYIDDQVAVNQGFTVGKQDNWIPFQFNLSKGSHKIRVESPNGTSTLKETFKIVDNHWAVVEYWYSPESDANPTPKNFTFYIKNKPINFK
ncbi:hypothetical protein KAR91_60735 [Candidatus Pacearchaeota archaeon]|nr:hypothetical protein [Candidatus Pacearchaeota archaeon]